MSDLVPKGLSAAQYAARLVVLKALEKRVTSLQKATKTAARSAFVAGDRKIAEHEGVRLGSVTLTKGRGGGFKVTDPRAFVAWCKVHRPTAVVVTESVRESDELSLLQAIEKGGPVPDGVEEVPGGDPYFTVTPDDAAVAQIDWRPYVGQPTQQIEEKHHA
jgi:hypothetical protein